MSTGTGGQPAGSINAGRDANTFTAGTMSFHGVTIIGGNISADDVLKIVAAQAASGTTTLRVRSNFADPASPIVWNRFFTGREDELSRLHAEVAKQSQAISHAVMGAGGVGKTELARAFAFLFGEEYAGVWWIDASDGGFSDSLSRAFRYVTGEAAPPDARPEHLAQHLGVLWSKGKHLVILDNLESAQRLDLFAIGGECRVLATTRKDLSAAATVASFKVDVLSEDSAVDLLAKQTAKRRVPIAPADLRAIAAEVACHTLAVALAGAYLAGYGDVTAAEYLDSLRKQGTGEADPRQEGEENDPLLLRYRHSVKSCLTLHFAKFAGGQEMVLLGLASFCHSTAIPLDLLATVMKADLSQVRKWAKTLADVSIVQYDATLSVHRLTQSVMRAMLDKETQQVIIDAIVGTLVFEFENPDHHTKWPRQSILAPHASALIGHGTERKATGALGNLANGLGSYLLKTGRYADAQRAYEMCVILTVSVFGAEHPNMAAILSNLAMIHQERGDLPGSRTSLERAIAIQSMHFPPDHPTLAVSWSNLTTIQYKQDDWAGAKASIEKAIAIQSKHFPPDHPTFAIRYSKLAIVQQGQGDLPGARASIEKAIAIESKHFAPDHPNFAIRYSNLATIQMDQGDLLGARKNTERAIAIEQKTLPPDHPTFATRYNNLGAICHRMGDRLQAAENFRKALRILLMHFGEDHPHVKAVRNHMSQGGYTE